MDNGAVEAIFGLISLVVFLPMIGLYIYMFVLFVKLAHRGIKAMDIYIRKNNPPYPSMPYSHNIPPYYSPDSPQIKRDNDKDPQ